jgi:hypothetical protein
VDKPLRESEYFVAWLLFFLLASVVGGLLGGAAGFVAGIVLGASGVDPSTIALASGALGFVLGVPVSYLSFRFIVSSMVVKKVVARCEIQVPAASVPLAPYPPAQQAPGVVAVGE